MLQETNNYLPVLLGCKSQAECSQAYPAVCVMFPILFDENIDRGSGPVSSDLSSLLSDLQKQNLLETYLL